MSQSILLPQYTHFRDAVSVGGGCIPHARGFLGGPYYQSSVLFVYHMPNDKAEEVSKATSVLSKM